MVINIPLITHVAKTNNKKAPNKYFKINFNELYSGNLHHHSRSIVMENLHNYIINYLPNTNLVNIKHLVLRFRVVKNIGDIRLIKGRYSWKKPKEDYEPSWDTDNYSFIWIKAIKDSLVLNGNLPDDTFSFINKTSFVFEIVDDIADMHISIEIR